MYCDKQPHKTKQTKNSHENKTPQETEDGGLKLNQIDMTYLHEIASGGG